MAGTIAADVLMDGAGNSTAMDNAIYGSAKAWVQFGVSGSVCTINASYNVSSVTYVGSGNYTINYTNAFADTHYSASGITNQNNYNAYMCLQTLNTSSTTVIVRNAANNAYVDNSIVCFTATR